MTGKKEIERKFIVKDYTYRQLTKGEYCCQGYLNDDIERVVRVRILDEKAFITVKGKNKGVIRPEYEYEIPLPDAQFMLNDLCLRPLIEKIRYRVPQGKLIWEIDEFLGENDGLIFAEVELPDENYPIDPPAWIGEEVTFDEKYYNVNLLKNPYKNW